MMRRQIFIWMGLFFLFLAFGSGRVASAADTYKVRSGDSLAKISKKFGVSITTLKTTNNLQSDALKPRQVLLIPKTKKTRISSTGKTTTPSAASYVVKSGDSLYSIAKRHGLSVRDLREINHISGSRLRLGQRLVLTKSPFPIDADGATEERGEASDLSALPEDDEGEEEGVDSAAANQSANADPLADNSSEILGKWESPSERQLFARVAMGFLGAPYRLGGSSVRGLDCSAFVKKIYEFFNVNLPRTAREQARVGKSISRNELEVGDLVFFNTRRRAFGHVGIYIGNNEFVHASSGRSRAVKVDTLDKPYYNKRFVKAVRLKALDDDV